MRKKALGELTLPYVCFNIVCPFILTFGVTNTMLEENAWSFRRGLTFFVTNRR